MELLQGRHAPVFAMSSLNRRLVDSACVLIDLGAGDGRFVRHMAQSRHDMIAVGIDACRDPLYAAARRAPSNAVFLVANVLALAGALDGAATLITLNFPWGSLMEGLLAGDEVAECLSRTARPGARLEMKLNADAFAEEGVDLETGADQICRMLRRAGFSASRPVCWNAAELRRFPSTWAKRLAFGRDPRAVAISAVRTNMVS